MGVSEDYSAIISASEAKLASLTPLSRRISWFRLAAFLVGASDFFVYAWVDGVPYTAAVIVGLAAFIAFVALVVKHRRVIRSIDTEIREIAICQEGRHRIARDWNALEPIAEPKVDDPLGIARDLDILGRTSLYRLTGGAATRFGQETLARWLLSPASAAESRSRAALVAELREKRDLLMAVQHIVRKTGRDTLDPKPFIEWAEGPTWLDRRPGVRWGARLLGPLPILLAVGAALGVVPSPLWMIAVAVNLAFTGIVVPKVHRIFDAVSAHKGRIDQYSVLFRFIAELNLTSERGKALKARLEANGLTAWRQMKKLEAIADFADLRFSPMVYFPVQIFSLHDVHVLEKMEAWQTRVGAHTPQWLDALGEFEAFIGLAILAHDNPTYTMANVVTDVPPTFAATDLGHPLLREDTAVTNDVTLGPPGTFLLVTGSNMSGKSSLLRSIGLNIALAGAGGPVAARDLALTPFVLGTSFRVVDSISDGVSFFMAELKRLKQIVTRAENRTPSDPPLLFLLDEILQGTNIVERRLAVTGVLKHLVALGALGAISSHDLTLADADGIGDKAHTVYFTEQFRDGAAGREMYFDYILRNGVAPTTNALELLKLAGLDFHDA